MAEMMTLEERLDRMVFWLEKRGERFTDGLGIEALVAIKDAQSLRARAEAAEKRVAELEAALNGAQEALRLVSASDGSYPALRDARIAYARLIDDRVAARAALERKP